MEINFNQKRNVHVKSHRNFEMHIGIVMVLMEMIHAPTSDTFQFKKDGKIKLYKVNQKFLHPNDQ